MYKLGLTQGKIALIDDCDVERVMCFKWFANFAPCTGGYYAKTNIPIRDRKMTTYPLHSYILGVDSSYTSIVDHINGNGLDNRRCNLRMATRSQNCANARMYSNNKTGFKGVFYRGKGRYRAMIRVDWKLKHLGTFSSPELAHEAYKLAALEEFGEFAKAL